MCMPTTEGISREVVIKQMIASLAFDCGDDKEDCCRDNFVKNCENRHWSYNMNNDLDIFCGSALFVTLAAWICTEFGFVTLSWPEIFAPICCQH